MSDPVNTSNFAQLLSKNLPFHAIINQEVEETPFGQITVNINLVNGVADLTTTNIVKNRRRKYDGKDIDPV